MRFRFIDAERAGLAMPIFRLRIPTQSGQCFRSKAASDSDLIRPPIPTQNGQSEWVSDRARWVIL